MSVKDNHYPDRNLFLQSSKCDYCNRIHTVENPCRGMKTRDALDRSDYNELGNYNPQKSYGQRLSDGWDLISKSGDI